MLVGVEILQSDWTPIFCSRTNLGIGLAPDLWEPGNKGGLGRLAMQHKCLICDIYMWLTIIVPAETESIVDKIKLLCILWQRTMVDLHRSKKRSTSSAASYCSQNLDDFQKSLLTLSHVARSPDVAGLFTLTCTSLTSGLASTEIKFAFCSFDTDKLKNNAIPSPKNSTNPESTVLS